MAQARRVPERAQVGRRAARPGPTRRTGPDVAVSRLMSVSAVVRPGLPALVAQVRGRRIAMQLDFASDLMDAIERGVGTLVDADMNEESTRLQALQVQQQLGIQALSIANAGVQGVMQLFQ